MADDDEDFYLVALLVIFFIMTILLGYHMIIIEFISEFLRYIRLSV